MLHWKPIIVTLLVIILKTGHYFFWEIGKVDSYNSRGLSDQETVLIADAHFCGLTQVIYSHRIYCSLGARTHTSHTYIAHVARFVVEMHVESEPLHAKREGDMDRRQIAHFLPLPLLSICVSSLAHYKPK